MALTLDTLGLSATVTAQGITAPDYQTILSAITDFFRQIYGSDAYLDPDSKDGQMVALVALAIHDANTSAIAVYNSFSPSTALSDGLTRNVKINGITRHGAVNSTADLTLTGTAGNGTANIALSPEGIGAIPTSAEKQLSTAWVNFGGINTVTVRDSFNVSSVVRESAGLYTINFATPMKNANYAVLCGFGDGAYAGNGSIALLINGSSGTGEAIKKDVNGVRVIVRGGAGTFDTAQCSIAIFGGL